jgi:hypothetical protein
MDLLPWLEIKRFLPPAPKRASSAARPESGGNHGWKSWLYSNAARSPTRTFVLCWKAANAVFHYVEDVNRRLALAAVALMAATACASSGGTAALDRGGGDPELARALDAAIAAGEARRGLRAEIECETDGGYRSAVVFEGGAGIWNRGRQFVLTETQVRDVLQAFRRHRFPELRETYGGREDPRRPPPRAVLRVACAATLRLGGMTKRVTQLEQGRQSPALKRLARDVLALCEAPGRRGRSAASLADGLRRIAASELAPETLVLSSHHKPEKADASGETGWLLHLEGRRVVTRPYTSDDYGRALVLTLPAEDVRALARVLLRGDIEAMPFNLDSRGYDDLEVRVLDQKRSIQARPFAGIDPAAQALARSAFETIREAIRDLHLRALREGEPEEPLSAERS